MNTPNDLEFDRCEADDETTPATQECTSYFGEQYKLFGFRPDSATTGGLPTQYLDPTQLDDRGRQANIQAGDPPNSMISGIRADLAWKYSAGRPDVVIAIFDNGIRWQSAELIEKVHLNAGELPPPTSPNGDGRTTVADYAANPGVSAADGEDEADGVLDASDLIAEFSNNADTDGNGYVDDIAGWDFFNDDNDPFDQSDCCQGGHGTGRATEAAGATNNGDGGAGVCPECTIMPLRTSDSIVHDTNLVALATTYAADNGASVTEGALGGLLNSSFARRAFRYADSKGVAQMMVSSDINSANHNYPTNYNEAVYVGGALPDTAPAENCQAPGLPGVPPAPGDGEAPGCDEFLDFFAEAGGPPVTVQPSTTSFFRNTNLTQYGGKADIVLMGATGSENTGQAAGAAGLLASYGRARYGTGDPLTGNEIRQLLTMSAEDVRPLNTGVIGQPDKANEGWDPHFGYGRVNLQAAMAKVGAGEIPPEVQLESPDWFAPINVGRVSPGGVPVRARISSPHFGGPVDWELEYACGQDALDSEFEPLSEGSADSVDGEIGRLSKGLLEQLAADCDGQIANDAGLPAGTPSEPWPANPYPSPDPMSHAFQIRLTAREPGTQNVGRYRKTLFAYDDDGTLEGWPRAVGPGEDDGKLVTGSGGEANPRLFDLDGDNALDVLLPTTSGELHALDSRGRPLASWNGGGPVTTGRYAQAGVHAAAPGVAALDGGPREALRTPAIGDVTGDGKPEVVVTAGEHLYAWHHDGGAVPGFPRRVDPSFSQACKNGGPRCFAPADRNLTPEKYLKRGFVGSPALADLDEDGTLDIVAGALDQRLYAWDGGGDQLSGFPVRLDSESPDDGAEIVASPTIADLDDDGDQEVVIATNEVLGGGGPDSPDEFDPRDLLNIFVGSATGRSVTYAVHGNGQPVAGWPVETGVLAGDILPLVVPSHDAAAGDLDPTNPGVEVSISAATGAARLISGGGTPLRTYSNQSAGGLVRDDSIQLNLADYPAIGRLSDALGPSVVKGGLSLAGVANLLAVNQNLEFNHTVQAWDPRTGAYRAAYPRATDDFQLLSQPVIAKAGGAGGGRQAIVGTGLYQLHAYGEGGQEPAGWPKFTGGWIFATPTVGDMNGDGELDVMTLTREGFAFAWGTGVPACQSGGTSTNDEWWSFSHDEHATARYGHDARPPGAPRGLGGERSGSTLTLAWRSPGDDLLCGDPARYRVIASRGRIDGPQDGTLLGEFDAGKGGSGAGRAVTLPPELRDGDIQVAVIYRDEAGNWGRPRTAGLAGLPGLPNGGGPEPGAGRGNAGRPCMPRRLGTSSRRIGPARLGASLAALQRRYRVARRSRRAVRFCVRGGGRFLVSARRGRIDFVASTARAHGTRGAKPGKKLRRGRLPGARRLGRGLLVGRRSGRGRVIYGVRGGRVRFLAVVSRGQAAKPGALKRRLRVLGLR